MSPGGWTKARVVGFCSLRATIPDETGLGSVAVCSYIVYTLLCGISHSSADWARWITVHVPTIKTYLYAIMTNKRNKKSQHIWR
jgi:hypothetical protein